MSTWEPLPVETSEDAVIDRIVAGLKTRLPGLEVVEGSIELALAEEIGRESALLAQRFTQLVDLAIAGMGVTVLGYPAGVAAAAELDVDLTVTGTGAIIPAGVTVVGTTIAGVEVAYTLPSQVTATGTTQTVTMEAVLPGTLGNGLVSGTALRVVTATATVISAVAASTSSGGQDAEDVDVYLARLADWISILRPGGVRARDLAILARSVDGVHRAIGVDLYNPATPGLRVERTATVFAVDSTGQPVTAPIKTALQAALEDVREVNFLIHVADPTYTSIDVTATVVPEVGTTAAAAAAAAETAVRAYLSPATWAAQSGVRDWVDVDEVRWLEVVQAVGAAPGVAAVLELELDGAGVDVPLGQPVGLPTVGTVTIEVAT